MTATVHSLASIFDLAQLRRPRKVPASLSRAYGNQVVAELFLKGRPGRSPSLKILSTTGRDLVKKDTPRERYLTRRYVTPGGSIGRIREHAYATGVGLLVRLLASTLHAADDTCDDRGHIVDSDQLPDPN
jgi:hypothetical protein